MKQRRTILYYLKRVWAYLKDYRFSSILLKYFLLLFICLVLPVSALGIWYAGRLKDNIREEIFKRNEESLRQAYINVNSVILSVKNLAYSFSVNDSVQYLAVRPSVSNDTTGNRDSLVEMLSIVGTANEYIDSSYLYFFNSGFKF